MKLFKHLFWLILFLFVFINNTYGCPQSPTTIASYSPIKTTYTDSDIIEFSGEGSHDNDAIQGQYHPAWTWDFDYSPEKGFQNEVFTQISWTNRSFAQPGTYNVAVIYSDDDGQTGNMVIMTITIVVANTLTSNVNNFISTLTPLSPCTDINNINIKKENIAYYNGLGKISQNISISASPSGYDIITPFEYDFLGLATESFLPYVDRTTNHGTYRSYAIYDQQSYYFSAPGIPNSIKASSLDVLQNSPLLTPQKHIFPSNGSSTIEVSTQTNNLINMQETSFKDNIFNLSYNSNDNTIIVNDYFSTGSLFKTESIDENNVSSFKFKDKNGKTVMVNGASGTSDETRVYYIYDKYNNLKFIISPEGSKLLLLLNTSIISSTDDIRKYWTTEYNYDEFNRRIEEIMPEENPVYTVYDPLGRVVLQQDGNLRIHNQWLFNKYDIQNHIIMTGLYNAETNIHMEIMGTNQIVSRDQIQNFINDNVGLGKEYAFSEEHTVSEGNGYTNQAFPVDNIVYWSINYFDNYDFDNNGNDDITFTPCGFSSIDYADPSYPNYVLNGHIPYYSINRKPTMSKVRIFGVSGIAQAFTGGTYNYNPPSPATLYYHGNISLENGFHTYLGQEVHFGPGITVPEEGVSDGSNDWKETTFFYDTCGRVIQTRTTNQLGGFDISSTQYDFSGKIIRNLVNHHTSYKSVNVLTRFTYDLDGRLLNTYQSIGNSSEKPISRNSYNELGQLLSKKLCYTDIGAKFLQTLDYKYHIRGWLKSVNDPYSIGDDLFAYMLNYEDAIGHGITNYSMYNGNISAMTVTYSSSPGSTYNYSYDNLNRLTGSQTFFQSTGNWIEVNNMKESGITYDLNGNIHTLQRYKQNGPEIIDNLIYGYNGNKLINVQDGVSGMNYSYEFKDGEKNLPVEYIYDGNGNMTRDENKKITITYNLMNLPIKVSWDNGSTIEWMYDAAGTKLRKTISSADGNVEYVQDYVNGFEYKTNNSNSTPELDFFTFSDGRVQCINGTSYEYQYCLKDHLGNTRVTFKDNNGVISPLENNYYYPFGLSVSTTFNGEENKYKYNGKELVDENGLYWNDYGARFYDPQLGRWHVMDPADQFHSPYLYGADNPIRSIDPDGKQTHNYQVLGPIVGGEAGGRVQLLGSLGLSTGAYTDGYNFDINVTASLGIGLGIGGYGNAGVVSYPYVDNIKNLRDYGGYGDAYVYFGSGVSGQISLTNAWEPGFIVPYSSVGYGGGIGFSLGITYTKNLVHADLSAVKAGCSSMLDFLKDGLSGFWNNLTGQATKNRIEEYEN